MQDYFYLVGTLDETAHYRVALQQNDEVFELASPYDDLGFIMQMQDTSNLIEQLQHAVVRPTHNAVVPIRIPHMASVWAAGVTYKISEEARERESKNSTIYTRVYHAERPELFEKAIGYEVVTSGDSVGIRFDASWSVPEPEFTVVYTANLKVIGFTIGNDMSSRDIEGANPLYLPQAKSYERSCAIGARIWLVPNATQWEIVKMSIQIERDGQILYSGNTTTQQLNRTLPELTDYLGRCKSFPYGVCLLTGTCLVPPDSFTLAQGDMVRIQIEHIGELVNEVVVVGNPR